MAGNGQGVQSQDIIKVSATSGFTPAPQARDHKVEVAKLIEQRNGRAWIGNECRSQWSPYH